MLDKSQAAIRSMFDRISPTYDMLNHLLSLNSDRTWRRKAADECPSAGLVLDLCSGTGDLAAAIAERRCSVVVGADLSLRMLRRARIKCAGRPIRLVQADALRLPFRDGSFDACAVAFGVRNLSDLASGLAEMRRVLKPGGRAVILEFSPPAARSFRRLYALYLSGLLAAVGDAVSRSRAYRYLSRSIGEWHDVKSFRARLEEAGFADVGAKSFSFGIASLYVGTRKD